MQNGFIPYRFIRTYIPGQKPTLNDIQFGQIALNVPDATLYIRAAQPNGIDIVKSIGNAPLSAVGLGGIPNTSVVNQNYVVSIPEGYRVGSYKNGDIIPAGTLTVTQLANLVLAVIKPPTVTITSTSTLLFNQTNISNLLNLQYTINSKNTDGLQANVGLVTLEWSRGSNGLWQTLSQNSSIVTYTHNLVDTPNNGLSFNYRYTVIDAAGGINQATLAITPTAYILPVVGIAVTGVNLVAPETDVSREFGNTATTLNGIIVKNSPSTLLISYAWQYKIDNGVWTAIGANTLITNTGTTVTLYHTDALLNTSKTNVSYRLSVVDGVGTIYSPVTTIDFHNLFFYGSSLDPQLSAAGIRGLYRCIETESSFVINTGITNQTFYIAIPSTKNVTSVVDLTSLNVNITNQYISSSINITNRLGTSVSYKLYKMSTGIPYTSNHRHQVTIS